MNKPLANTAIEAALAIVIRETESWGESRAKYPISSEDAKTLIEAGAMRLTKNHDNGDGTFLNVLSFESKTFEVSSSEQL